MVNVIDVRAQPRTNDIVVICAPPQASYGTWEALYKHFPDVLIVIEMKDVPMSGRAYLIRTTIPPEERGSLNQRRKEIYEWLKSSDGGEDPSDLQLASG